MNVRSPVRVGRSSSLPGATRVALDAANDTSPCMSHPPTGIRWDESRPRLLLPTAKLSACIIDSCKLHAQVRVLRDGHEVAQAGRRGALVEQHRADQAVAVRDARL